MAETATLALPSASRQTISDILSKALAESVADVVQPTVQELVHEAQMFKVNITNYKNILQNLNNIELQEQRRYIAEEEFRTDRDIEAIISSTRKGKTLADTHHNQYKKLQSFNYSQAILRFQNKLNNFLGQRMVLTLVNNETGTIYFSVTENYDKYLYLAINNKNPEEFTLRFKDNIQTMVRQMQANGEIIEQVDIKSLIEAEKSEQTKVALENVQWAHRSALWRINRSFEVHPKVGIILWKSLVRKRPKLHGWYGVVANRGVIAEAYAEILITKQEDVFYTTNRTIEPLLDIFILDYMNRVTNAAGAVFGDINDTINNLDYAVKTSKASLKLESQLLTYADIILKNSKASEKDLTDKIQAQQQKDMQGNPIMAEGMDRVFQALGDYAYYEVNQIIKEINNYNNSQSNWWDKR